MSTESHSRITEYATFENTDVRSDEMHAEVERFLKTLTDPSQVVQGTAEFLEFLDVAASLSRYSYANLLLIRAQYPEATKIAGYDQWQEKYDRQVVDGADNIWVRKPIWRPQCPACGNSHEYHVTGKVECSQHQIGNPDEWFRGVVGFRAVNRYDVSQTRGEPLFGRDWTAVTDDCPRELLQTVIRVGESKLEQVRLVPRDEWTHSRPIEVSRSVMSLGPQLAVRRRASPQKNIRALLRGIPFALWCAEVGEDAYAKEIPPLRAQSVAAIVGKCFGVDVSGIRVDVSRWHGRQTEDIRSELDNVQDTSHSLIRAIKTQLGGQSE